MIFSPSSPQHKQSQQGNFQFDDLWADSHATTGNVPASHLGIDFGIDTSPHSPHRYVLTPPSPIYEDHELPSTAPSRSFSHFTDASAIMSDEFDDLNALSTSLQRDGATSKPDTAVKTEPIVNRTTTKAASKANTKRRSSTKTSSKKMTSSTKISRAAAAATVTTPTHKEDANVSFGSSKCLPTPKNNDVVCTQSELLSDKEYDYWTVLSQNPTFVHLDKKPSKEHLFITIRTRTDPESAHFMNKMYSSLRYSMVFKLSQSVFTEEALQTEGDLKTQCEIVYAESIDRLARNSRTAQYLIQMDNHAPLLLKKAENYETKQKLSFSDVSYHHKNSAFRLKITMYHTGISHSDSILTIISSPFHLYARRPKTEVKNSRKRKKPGNPSITQPASKRKKTLQSTLQPLQKLKVEEPAVGAMEKLPENVTNAFALIEQLQLIKKESSAEEWQLVENQLRTVLPVQPEKQEG